jgi:hypothetical protein
MYKYNSETNTILAQVKQPTSSNEQLLVNLSQNQLLVTNSFKRLQVLDKSTFKFQSTDALGYA